MAAPLKLTRTHRILVGLVVAGALIIAAIGFTGSYSAVRALAERKGFGAFSVAFPIGIDAGIVVLLSLDLLLTWIRIPFPLLRQTAWLLTAATIAFNGAAAWPDPLGVGMHAVIPVLFVVAVEAARHAVGRIADITADKHMEGVRLTRWLLSPLPTFLLWRRMKLWELRSYEQTIRLEQERLIYQARLHSRYGRGWRRKAPVESLMPLRLARYGVPLAETAPAGLAAAGIEPVLLPKVPGSAQNAKGELAAGAAQDAGPAADAGSRDGTGRAGTVAPGAAQDAVGPWSVPRHPPYGRNGHGGYGGYAGYQGQDGAYDPSYDPPEQYEQWYAEQAAQQQYAQQPQQYAQQPQPEDAPQQGPRPEPQFGPQPQPEDEPLEMPTDSGIRVPAGAGSRTRPLSANHLPIPGPRPEQGGYEAVPAVEGEEPAASALPDGMSREDAYFQAFQRYVKENLDFPNTRQLGLYLQDLYGVTGQSGGPLTESTLRPYVRDFRRRYQQELDANDAEQIA